MLTAGELLAAMAGGGGSGGGRPGVGGSGGSGGGGGLLIRNGNSDITAALVGICEVRYCCKLSVGSGRRGSDGIGGND